MDANRCVHVGLSLYLLTFIGRDARTGVNCGVTAALPFEKVGNGAQVPLRTSIISDFMIYQDQFETNLLRLFAHT